MSSECTSGENRERQSLIRVESGAGNSIISYETIEDQTTTNTRGAKIMRNRFRIQIYAVALIFMFIGCFSIVSLMMIIPRTQEFVDKSVEMDIKNVKIDKISTHGIDLKVEGSNVIHYDGIENSYFSTLFKAGGGIFHTATIKMNPILLQIQIPNVNEVIDIGSVELPEFNINIKDGESTIIDLLVTVHPKTLQLLKLVKSLLSNPDMIFEVFGDSIMNIKLGAIPIGKFKVNFVQQIVGSEYIDFNMKELAFEHFSLKEIELPVNHYDLDMILKVPNPIKYKLIGFSVPRLTWDFFVEDCFQEPVINIFSDEGLISEALTISPLDSDLILNLSSSISQFDKRLSQGCPTDNNDTPMKNLINEFVSNQTLPIRIKKREGSTELPSFMDELLDYFDWNFNYYSNINNLSKFVQNVSIDHLNFEFQDGDTERPIINGKVELFLKIPWNLTDVKIDSVKGLPKLYYEGEEFGEIQLNEWHLCSNEIMQDFDENSQLVRYLHVGFDLNNENIIIVNRSLFGKVINEIIGEGSAKIFVDAYLDAKVKYLLGEVEFDGLHASSESVITRSYLLKSFGIT